MLNWKLRYRFRRRNKHRGICSPRQSVQAADRSASAGRQARYHAAGRRHAADGRPRRGLDDGQGRGRRSRHRSRSSGATTSATTPSSPKRCLEFLKRMEAEVGITAGAHAAFSSPAAAAGGMAPLHRREVRAGSERRVAGGREALSRVRLGDRAGRPGRQDHHLQGRPRDRPQEENSLDERQVRRRHGRGHRQDQRQAAHSRRAALQDGLSRA